MSDIRRSKDNGLLRKKRYSVNFRHRKPTRRRLDSEQWPEHENVQQLPDRASVVYFSMRTLVRHLVLTNLERTRRQYKYNTQLTCMISQYTLLGGVYDVPFDSSLSPASHDAIVERGHQNSFVFRCFLCSVNLNGWWRHNTRDRRSNEKRWSHNYMASLMYCWPQQSTQQGRPRQHGIVIYLMSPPEQRLVGQSKSKSMLCRHLADRYIAALWSYRCLF